MIAPEENMRIMKEKYKSAFEYLNKNFPEFLKYNNDRQKALSDMCYNLGISKFSKYKNMKRAILSNDWKIAARESWRNGIEYDRNIKTIFRLYPFFNVKELPKWSE